MRSKTQLPFSELIKAVGLKVLTHFGPGLFVYSRDKPSSTKGLPPGSVLRNGEKNSSDFFFSMPGKNPGQLQTRQMHY